MNWKIIEGFTDYKVNENGEVYSIKRNKILKQYEKKNYLGVYLYQDNKRKFKAVHRLVAESFIDNPYNLPQVNHKDENSMNNNVSNLEWCTQKYNMNYGTCPYRIGKANSKIIAQFDKSGNFIKNYNSIIEAERQTNISNGTICDVLKGRRKSAGGFLWEYAQ